MAYLYRHIRKDTNQVFYVGIGSDAAGKYKRANERDKSKRSTFWLRITQKTDCDIEIILDNLSWKEAKQKEVEFIRLYGRKNLGLGTLCNLTDGGDGTVGQIFSEEARAKIRQAVRGRTHTEESKRLISEKGKGRKHSSEEILKRALSMTGLKRPNFKGKLVLNLETGIYYLSISEAARAYNLPSSTLSHYIKGERGSRNSFLLV